MLERLGAGFRSWREASLAPFDHKLFRALWLAAFASNIGAAIQTTAAAWTMTGLTSSPQMVALVQTAASLPIVLLALPSGAMADNADRRLVMLGSQLLGCATALTLATMSTLGQVSAWSLLACTSLIGAAMALHQPAWQASLADFVPRQALPAAISLNVLAFNAARSVGPALGGTLIVVAGATAAFAFNAFSFLGIILVLALARLPPADRRGAPEPILPAMASGMRYVAMSPGLKRVYLRAALFGLGASAVWSLLPLVAQRLGGGPAAFGVLMGALGSGSFFGALIAAWLRVLTGAGRLVTGSVLAFAAATTGIGFSPWLAASATLAFVCGASWIFIFTTTRTCIQLTSPRWVVGRAVSLGQVASFGAMALGSAGWGLVASRIGVAEAVVASGVFLAASTLAAFVAPLPVTDTNDWSVAAPPRSRPPALPVDRHSVVITIEYEVALEKTPAFLALADQLRLIRRRNGAMRWTLHQDIDQPEVWIERIHCGSWQDHVRRIARYTAAEQAVLSQAEVFRSGVSRPLRRLLLRNPRTKM